MSSQGEPRRRSWNGVNWDGARLFQDAVEESAGAPTEEVRQAWLELAKAVLFIDRYRAFLRSAAETKQ